MEWIKVDVRLKENIKVRRLARRLNVSIQEISGNLLFLWSWAAINNKDGDLSELDDDDIADAADYQSDSKKFIDALIDVGLLDSDRRLHDWDEHNGASLKKQEERKQYFKERRQKIKCARTESAQCAHRESTDNAQEEHRGSTESAQAAHIERTALRSKNKEKDLKIFCSKIEFSSDTNEANKPESKTPKKRGRPQKYDGYTDDFQAFWDLYPRKIEKQRAFKCWLTKLKQGAKPSELISAAKHYAEMCRSHNREPEMIKHAATFLGPTEPWEEYIDGVPKEAKTSYERAIESGPALDGFLGELLGDSNKPTFDADFTEVETENDRDRLAQIRGTDAGSGRGDDWEPPY